MALWDGPLYNLTARSGKSITIDVTLSVNPNLPPNQAIHAVIAFFKRKRVRRVLDFGAGALRHALPVLKAGFEVCAVEFAEQYAAIDSKTICCQRRREAERDPNFSELVYPKQFIRDHRSFDAALLCYTMQGMPVADERVKALSLIHSKLEDPGYLVWMSRYDALEMPDSQRVRDGHYKTPTGCKNHTFYREWKTPEIHELVRHVGWRKSFHHVKSLGQGRRDQLFIYATRTEETWV